MENNGGDLEEDVVFDLLSNSRRRHVLTYLLNHGRKATIQKLARSIAARENGIPVEEVTKEQQKRTYVSLYQTHVPYLEDAGLVTRDEETGTIVLEDSVEDIESYLPENRIQERPWHWYYFVIVVFSAALFALVVLDVSVFDALTPSVVVAGVIAALWVITLVYISHIRRSPKEGGLWLLSM